MHRPYRLIVIVLVTLEMRKHKGGSHRRRHGRVGPAHRAPDHFVENTVLGRLQLLSGFQQLRTAALIGGFKFDLTGFQVSQVTDHSHQGLTPPPNPTPPSFAARVALPGRRLLQIPFAASLKGVTAGEACIFHLIQTSINDVAQGGLTLVVLKL